MNAQSTSGDSPGVRVLGRAFLVLFVLLCIAALVGYFGWSGRPAHWADQQARIQAMPQPQREQVSEALMNRLLNQWSQSPPNATTIEELIGQRNTLEIPFEELNIWLAEEGIELLTEVDIKMPRSVKGAMIDSPGDGLLRITCDLDNGKIQQVVSMSFDIAVAEDGTVTSTLQSAAAGRLPLPTQAAVDLIAQRGDAGARLLALMQGTPVGPVDIPIDPSKDGLRDGRLVGLQVREDALIVTRETVRREKTNNH